MFVLSAPEFLCDIQREAYQQSLRAHSLQRRKKNEKTNIIGHTKTNLISCVFDAKGRELLSATAHKEELQNNETQQHQMQHKTNQCNHVAQLIALVDILRE